MLAQRLAAHKPPDSFQGHAGAELLDYIKAGQTGADRLIYTKYGLKNVMPAQLIHQISYKGHLLGAGEHPPREHPLVQPESPEDGRHHVPLKTWAEFIAALQKRQGKRRTSDPLALGEQWTQKHLLETIMIATLGPAGWAKLWTKGGNWNSAGVTTALNRFKTLLTYTNSDAASLTWQDAGKLVADGKAAFNVMGDWQDGYFGGLLTRKPGQEARHRLQLDMPFPGRAASTTGCPTASRCRRAHRTAQAAVKWLGFLGSKKAQDTFNPVKGSIPARKDANAAVRPVPEVGAHAVEDRQAGRLADARRRRQQRLERAVDTALGLFLQSKDVAASRAARRGREEERPSSEAGEETDGCATTDARSRETESQGEERSSVGPGLLLVSLDRPDRGLRLRPHRLEHQGVVERLASGAASLSLRRPRGVPRPAARRGLHGSRLPQLLVFTVVFVLGTLIIGGTARRLLLDKGVKGEGFFRAVYLFPMAVSFIAAGIVWRWLMNPAPGDRATGLNVVFDKLGLGSWPTSGTSTVSRNIRAMAAMAMPAIWALSGYIMALYLAGFRGVPEELREAARMDGASEWRVYRHVVFPHLRPVTLSALIILGHISIKVFDLIVAIGGKQLITQAPAVYMWIQIYDAQDYAKGAAIATLLLLGISVLIIPYLIYTVRSGAADVTTVGGHQLRPGRRWFAAGRAGRGSRPVKYAALLIFAVIVLIPAYVLVVTSFKSLDEIDPSHAWSLPHVWTLSAWHDAWTQLSPNMKNSFNLVIPATLLSTMLGSLNGFVLSKWRFPGADVVFTFFLFGMFIPYQAVMIPLTSCRERALPGRLSWGLILTHIGLRHPDHHADLPQLLRRHPDRGLMEAARMDGAGDASAPTRRIILPLSAPAFVVAAIWQFTSIWNDFLFAVFFDTDPQMWPVTVALNNTGRLASSSNGTCRCRARSRGDSDASSSTFCLAGSLCAVSMARALKRIDQRAADGTGGFTTKTSPRSSAKFHRCQ